MNYSNRFSTLLILICFTIISCKNNSKKQPPARQNPPTIVDVLIAEPTAVRNVVEANGTVIAGEYVELRPEVSGRLTYLNIPEGRNIAKGAVIARINDADLRAQLNKSKVQLDLAQKTVERYQKLLDVSGINQSDYDIAVNTVNGFRADIAYQESLIAKTVIRAPFSGVAGLRQVSPGAYVSPTSILATIQQLDKVKIDFTLPEVYTYAVTIGSKVNIQTGVDTSKEKLTATVIAIEPGANTETRNIKVRAQLNGATVNPGAFVKVMLDEGKSRKSIMVPTNCIIPDDKSNQLIVVKNGQANFVNVQTGNREANLVEITSGLQQGDSVVITGVLFARPKAKLNVRSVKTVQSLKNETGDAN